MTQYPDQFPRDLPPDLYDPQPTYALSGKPSRFGDWVVIGAIMCAVAAIGVLLAVGVLN